MKEVIVISYDWVRQICINPLTPRCAEFLRWLQCRTIYRKKMKKDRKLHILPFLGSLFQMTQSEFSKMALNPLSFQKYPKRRYFWGTIFFLIQIFTMFPTLKQLLTYQKRVLETCNFKICIDIFCFSAFSNSKWRLDVLNVLKLRILILFRCFQVTS